MTVISSQRYLNDDIIAEKSITGDIELGVYETGIDDYYVLFDGHHTRAAAIAAGYKVIYHVVDHPEMLTGDDLLAASYIDSDWYDISTGIIVF